MGPGERLLELLQLEAGEGCPVPPLLPHLGDAVLVPHLPDPDLRPGVSPGRAAGAGPQDVRVIVTLVSDGLRVLAMVSSLLLELPGLGDLGLVLGAGLLEAHDVGDEEGSGAGLGGSREVSWLEAGGREAGHSDAPCSLHGGGAGQGWRHTHSRAEQNKIRNGAEKIARQSRRGDNLSAK